MKFWIFLLFILLFFHCSSQNLIWNGSFENSSLPHDARVKANTDSLENWSDFGSLNLHLNKYCGGKSFDGVSYIDLKLYSHHIKDYREYAEARLTCPLIKGERYILRFRTLPIKGRYLIGNIGAYLSEKRLDISGRKLLNVVPTIISRQGAIVGNTNDYTLIEDTITAKGGEAYIILGNFNADKGTTIQKSGFDTTYKYYSATYAFDDIELIPLNPNECPEASIKPMVITDTVNHIDTIFSLEEIHFATNSYEPLGNFDEMYKIVQRLLNQDSSLVVKVSGFTDVTGTKALNFDLSLKRAAAISQQLNQMGIACQKIYYSGYGSDLPVQNVGGGSLANRRVELNIAPYVVMKSSGLHSFCDRQK